MNSDRLKITISLLAILFFAINAWQTKNVADLGWTLIVITWTWPEPKPTAETKKTTSL